MKKIALVVLTLCALWLAPAHAQQTGPIYCGASATATVGAAIGQVVPAPGTGAARTYICSFTITATTATSVTFQYGTGTNCGTGTTTFGPTIDVGTAATFTEGADTFHGFVTPPGQAVCVTPTVASAIVTIYYVQQ